VPAGDAPGDRPRGGIVLIEVGLAATDAIDKRYCSVIALGSLRGMHRQAGAVLDEDGGG
jgi:hypothetical protein